MQITETKQAHCRQHQNAVACSEIAPVNCREKLKDNCSEPPRCVRLSYNWLQLETPINCTLQREKNCREQNQEGHQPCKQKRWGEDQKPRADSSTYYAY